MNINLQGKLTTNFPRPYAENQLNVGIGETKQLFYCSHQPGFGFYITTARDLASRVYSNEKVFDELEKIITNNSKCYKTVDGLIVGIAKFYKLYISTLTGTEVEDININFELQFHPASIYNFPENDFCSLKEGIKPEVKIYENIKTIEKLK